MRPDGLIRVSVGKRVAYQALVETKTGTTRLGAAQINAYLDAARALGCDAVVTISNEIAPAPGVHPTDGLWVRSNSKVAVHHLSWMLIMSEAVKEHAHRGVEDPEQAWILEELIRYLSHPKSGVLDFADMGENWTAVRDASAEGRLARDSAEAVEVCQRWDQLLRVAALRLGTEIGSDVTEVIPRAHLRNPRQRNKEFVQSLCTGGTLAGALRVPDAISDIVVTADIKASRLTLAAAFAAPNDRTARASVVWLVKQLKASPGSLLVDTYERNARHPVTATLEELRDDPCRALAAGKPAPARFRLRYTTAMGHARRTRRQKGFTDSVLDAVISFYSEVLQDLKPFVPRAPAIERLNTPNPEAAIEPPGDHPQAPAPHAKDDPPAQAASRPGRQCWSDGGRSDVLSGPGVWQQNACEYADCMASFQIRNVPDDLHRQLKSRAASEGQSLSEYALLELRRAMQRPTRRELAERVAAFERATVSESAAQAVRAERDGR